MKAPLKELGELPHITGVQLETAEKPADSGTESEASTCGTGLCNKGFEAASGPT